MPPEVSTTRRLPSSTSSHEASDRGPGTVPVAADRRSRTLTMNRNAEAALVIAASTVAAMGVALVNFTVGDGLDAQVALTFLVFVAAFGGVHLSMRRWAPTANPYLLPLAGFLAAIGFTELYRLRPDLAGLQRWSFLVAGAGASLVLYALRDEGVAMLRRYRYIFLTTAVILLLLPLLPETWPLRGAEVNGSRLWVRLTLPFGSGQTLSFQPGEVAKILLTVFLASYLAERQRIAGDHAPHHRPLPGAGATPTWGRSSLPPRASFAVLVYQRDLGASLLLFALFVGLLYVATGPHRIPRGRGRLDRRWRAPGLPAVRPRRSAGSSPGSIPSTTTSTRGTRSPRASLRSAAEASPDRDWDWDRPDLIPEAATDFMFAAVAEEMGLAGSIAVIVAFALFVAAGFGIALRARDLFRKFLAAGLTIVFAVQAFLIIAGCRETPPGNRHHAALHVVRRLVTPRQHDPRGPAGADLAWGARMNGPLRRVAVAMFVAFGLLVASVTWLQVVQASTYRDDPRNLRVAAGQSGRERGTIITSDGVIVAVSDADPSDNRVYRRSYPEGDLYAHVVGYSTVLFGSTGLERARSAELVSDRDATISGVINAILGGDLRPRGLRLTINHDVQVGGG